MTSVPDPWKAARAYDHFQAGRLTLSQTLVRIFDAYFNPQRAYAEPAVFDWAAWGKARGAVPYPTPLTETRTFLVLDRFWPIF